MNKFTLMLLLAASTGCTSLAPETPFLSERDTAMLVQDEDKDGVSDYWDQCADTPQVAGVTDRGCPRDSNGNGTPDYLEGCYQPSASEIDTACRNTMLTVNQFAYDSAFLSAAIRSKLTRLGMVLAVPNDPPTLVITGHTDSVGSDDYNQWLSERRAHQVASYLLEQSRSDLKLQVFGEGERTPLSNNHTPAGREMNRRVEIAVHSIESLVGLMPTRLHQEK